MEGKVRKKASKDDRTKLLNLAKAVLQPGLTPSQREVLQAKLTKRIGRPEGQPVSSLVLCCTNTSGLHRSDVSMCLLWPKKRQYMLQVAAAGKSSSLLRLGLSKTSATAVPTILTAAEKARLGKRLQRFADTTAEATIISSKQVGCAF